MLPFARQLEYLGYAGLQAENFSTLQVSLGWRCNQACKHCHLMAGPHRPEQMQRDTIDAIIRVVERWTIPCVDLTGGAPELNPHYESLVERLDRLGTHILTRCNLTILLEPGKEHLAEFYRDHRVELVGSLPYYQADLVDRLSDDEPWGTVRECLIEALDAGTDATILPIPTADEARKGRNGNNT